MGTSLTPPPVGDNVPSQAPSGDAGEPTTPAAGHAPAVAALLASLTLVLAPVAVVLGVVALRRLPPGNRRGRALALAGTGLSAAVLVTAVSVATFHVTAPGDTDGGAPQAASAAASGGDVPPPDVPGETVPLSGLEVGDCFLSPTRDDHADGTPWTSVTVSSCAQPHHAEVFAVFEPGEVAEPGQPAGADRSDEAAAEEQPDAPSGDGRGDAAGTTPDQADSPPSVEALDTMAMRECGRAVGPYLVDDWTLAARGWQILYLPPDEERWDAGDRAIPCLFATPDTATATDSLRGDRADFDAEQLTLLESGTELDALLWSEPDPSTALPERARWAAAAADRSTEQADTLRAHDWADPAVAEAAAEVAELRDASADHWREAAAAGLADATETEGNAASGDAEGNAENGDAEAFDAAHRQAYALHGGDAERELRALLGLETDGP